MLNSVVIALLAAAPAPAAEASAERTPPARPPSEMTNSEIKAYNDGLAMTHPYYIKCRKIEEIGSWVKKARVCRTNEQWKQAWAQGNQNARDTAEAMTRAPVNSSN
jgi:predicted component of type VI protein secretion system